MTLPANPYGCAAVTVAVPTEARLMSRFGMRQGVSSGVRRLHAGLDVGGRRGQPIFSARAGVVALVGQESTRRGPLDGYGNAVVVHHADEGKWVLYAHLSSVAVNEGQEIAAGTQVGTMGATTNGKFPRMVAHLHLEVRRAQADGRSPFPGRYGAFNEDPALWLAGHGLGFSRDGLTWDAARGACAAGGPAELFAALHGAPRLRAQGAQMLGGTPAGPGRIWHRVGGTADSPSMLSLPIVGTAPSYEPPIPDPDWFRLAPAWVRFGLPVATIGAGLLGFGLVLGALER